MFPPLRQAAFRPRRSRLWTVATHSTSNSEPSRAPIPSSATTQSAGGHRPDHTIAFPHALESRLEPRSRIPSECGTPILEEKRSPRHVSECPGHENAKSTDHSWYEQLLQNQAFGFHAGRRLSSSSQARRSGGLVAMLMRDDLARAGPLDLSRPGFDHERRFDERVLTYLRGGKGSPWLRQQARPHCC